MNAAEDSGYTPGLGWVWHFIPALWLLVGTAGFFTLSYWPELFAEPQVFAEPRRADRSPDCAECSGRNADEVRAESP
jgi:hypothetical protein